MRKKLLVALFAAAAIASVTIGAGVAYGIATYRIAGTTDRQYIATSTDQFSTPGPNTWQTVPLTSVTAVIPSGRQLLTARFDAESLCVGTGWCAVRVVYMPVSGPLTELAPQSGTDFAFDSDGDLWSQHSVERTSAVYLRAGAYRVSVQAMRVNTTQFRLDDYHLNVSLIAP